MTKIKAGLAFNKDIANENTNLALILKETAAIPELASRNDATPQAYTDTVYEDPHPEKRAQTSQRIAEIMAEERKKKAEFKEFQRKVRESKEAIAAAKRALIKGSVQEAEGGVKEEGGGGEGGPNGGQEGDDTKAVKNEYKSPNKGAAKKKK